MATYDPDKKKAENHRYYVKKKKLKELSAKDERKLAVSLRWRESLVSQLHRMVNEGIAKGTYPWRSMSECTSTLIIEGLKHADYHDNEMIEEILPGLECMQQIDVLQRQRRDAQTLLNRARDEISELKGLNLESAVNCYHVTMEAFEKMSPTPWRDWAIREMEKAFPDLEKMTPKGVSLAPAKAKNRFKGKHK